MVSAKTIKDYARLIPLDDIRITSAESFRDARREINEQVQQDLFLPDRRWSKSNVHRFCRARSKLTGARSILTGCLFYYTGESPDGSRPGNAHGLIARYTWRNYYRELRKRMRQLAHFLKKEYHASFRTYANGPIAEKPAARRSGLGYYGKHSIIMHPRYGSWIVLGEIVTDLEIETDQPLPQNCGDCRRCIDACPTKAIVRPYVIDRRRCIQALSTWPGILPADIMAVWGRRLYGCSTCQDVCPVNHKVRPDRNAATDIGVIGPSLSLRAILGMDEPTYRAEYANNQITRSWVNFSMIQRNALIALRQSKDGGARSLLDRFTRNPDPVLAETARWVLAES